MPRLEIDAGKDLRALTSPTIARVYDALHDMKDGQLHSICMDILWERHGQDAGEWPVHQAEIGPITLEIDGDRKEFLPKITSHPVQMYCRTDKRAKPNDPAHRLARRLLFSYQDCGGRERIFRHWQCLCGARTDLDSLVRGIHRIAPLRADVWPSAVIPGVNNGYPVFVVCKFAQGTQDPLHAPGSLGDRCMCGGSLGIANSWNDPPGTDQYLSVY